jgi:hypothetical protein
MHCRNECARDSNTGYFAYSTSKTCTCYLASGECPDDRKYVAVVFFTPKFLFFILVPYFVKPGNELCTDYGYQLSTDIIETLEECKVAISNLGLNFIGTHSYLGNTPWESRPKGCYAWRGGPNSYWNTHSAGKSQSNAYPICKIEKCEKIE